MATAMQTAQPRQSTASNQKATISNQSTASFPSPVRNTFRRTLEDLVSTPPPRITFLFLFLADNPDVQPRKDYDDYTTFINDSFAGDKESLIQKASTRMSKKRTNDDFKTKPKINTLMSPTSSSVNYGHTTKNIDAPRFSVAPPFQQNQIKTKDLQKYLNVIMKQQGN